MDQEKIGKFIAKCRKSKKLTQAQLSEKLGVSDRSVSNWENGKCMPDLSLFNELCKELDITVNELLSGEKISENEYREKLEENIINVVATVEQKNKSYNKLKLILLSFISLICLFIIVVIFSNTIYFNQKYDKENMYVEKLDKGIRFTVKNNCSIYSGNVRHIITSIDKENIIFVNVKCNINDIYLSSKKQSEEINLNSNSYRYENIDTSSLKKYKIYYTTYSLNNIYKASTKKLNEIIKKSTLIYKTS